MAVIEQSMARGLRVLDPFARYGTTLLVAERLDREAVDVELLPRRAELIRGRLAGRAEVVTGDARQLTALMAGPVDLCLTSPPYMTATGHPDNALTAYQTRDGDYPTYLAQLGDIFGRSPSCCVPAATP